MARTNYKFKKRQKELKKQKKREEKLLRKHAKKNPDSDVDPMGLDGEDEAPSEDAASPS